MCYLKRQTAYLHFIRYFKKWTELSKKTKWYYILKRKDVLIQARKIFNSKQHLRVMIQKRQMLSTKMQSFVLFKFSAQLEFYCH